MTKEETHQAFLNTTYKVKGNYNFDIKINSLVENANHLDSYAFITAWNPLPVILSLEENRKRNQKLENELTNEYLICTKNFYLEYADCNKIKHDSISKEYINPENGSKNIIVNKRSMKPGYAGIENELFFQPKTSMLFGDAKKVLQELCAEVKAI